MIISLVLQVDGNIQPRKKRGDKSSSVFTRVPLPPCGPGGPGFPCTKQSLFLLIENINFQNTYS